MSALLITGLVLAGIVVLASIAFINHSLENARLQKARRKAELSERLKRCVVLSEGFPGQFMSPALKQLLNRLEMEFANQLARIDPRDVSLKGRIEDLRTQLAMGESIAINNPVQQIQTEAKAKEVRFQLEDLHALLARAQGDGVLQAAEAKRWASEVKHLLVMLHVEFFRNLGQQALQQGQARQARLAFERGTQYLNKQPDLARYQKEQQQLQQLLNQANAMVLESDKPQANQPSELADSLPDQNEDDPWKKKNLYD